MGDGRTGVFVTPLENLALHYLLTAHLLQNVVLAEWAPALLVLGIPATLAARIARVRGVATLTHPLVALPLWTLSLYAWHLDALYVGSVNHPALHALQHTCFVGFGMAMWMPLFGPLPKPAWFGNTAKLAYIVAVRLSGAVLANVLVWSQTVLYPGYAGERRYGKSRVGGGST